MATRTCPIKILSLAVLVLVVLVMDITYARADLLLTKTKMSFYLRDFARGPNATLVAVAGPEGKDRSFTQFGSVFVTDDRIAETPDINSATIGRLQGMYATSSLEGLNSHVMVLVVFTNKAYNGSTIEIQGNSKQFEAVREVSFMSGTGKFRYKRGYATFETLYVDTAAAYSILRFNISVLHF